MRIFCNLKAMLKLNELSRSNIPKAEGETGEGGQTVEAGGNEMVAGVEIYR